MDYTKSLAARRSGDEHFSNAQSAFLQLNGYALHGKNEGLSGINRNVRTSYIQALGKRSDDCWLSSISMSAVFPE